MILLIVYGSLYPWHFAARDIAGNPFSYLMSAWAFVPDRRNLADVLVNIALYMPLGMSAYLALSRGKGRWSRLAVPVFIGFTLSASIEMVQIYVPSRESSAVDWVNNTLGSSLGMLCGILFERMARPVRITIPDRAALALLFCWAGALLFPLFPVMWLAEYRSRLGRLSADSWFEPVVALSAMAMWFAAARLIDAAHLKPSQRWLGASLLLIPAQFFIIGREPRPAQLLGAIAGIAVSLPLKNNVYAGIWMVFATIVRGLVPFTFQGQATPFSTLPFGGFLQTSWQTGMQILIEKAFWYGAPIWLLSEYGLFRATGIITVILSGIEIIQMRLPGRTPEITDPVMAILLGAGLWALRKKRADVAVRPYRSTQQPTR